LLLQRRDLRLRLGPLFRRRGADYLDERLQCRIKRGCGRSADDLIAADNVAANRADRARDIHPARYIHRRRRPRSRLSEVVPDRVLHVLNVLLTSRQSPDVTEQLARGRNDLWVLIRFRGNSLLLQRLLSPSRRRTCLEPLDCVDKIALRSKLSREQPLDGGIGIGNRLLAYLGYATC